MTNKRSGEYQMILSAFFYLRYVRKTNSNLRPSLPVLLLPVIIFCLHSCNNHRLSLDSLEEKIKFHQDSMAQVFFIPAKSNLKSELTFFHQILTEFEQISSSEKDSLQLDLLKTAVKNEIENTKNWTIGLENYDLRNIIENRFTETVFLDKNYLSQVPLFYRKGKENLKKDALKNFDTAIKKQTETYWYLKNKLNTESPSKEEALFAVKDFIAFLTSLKNESELKEKVAPR